MTIPGTLGQVAPPAADDLQRQLRDLAHEIAALRTAATQMAVETSAFVTQDYNGSTANQTIDPAGQFMHGAYVTVPEGYTRAVFYSTVSVGGTNLDSVPHYIYCYAMIEAPGEDVTDPTGIYSTGDQIARAVPGTYGDSVSSTFCRTLDGLEAGGEIFLGVIGACDSPSPFGGTANGHISALIVFFR
jgi:hypothetical protein